MAAAKSIYTRLNPRVRVHPPQVAAKLRVREGSKVRREFLGRADIVRGRQQNGNNAVRYGDQEALPRSLPSAQLGPRPRVAQRPSYYSSVFCC